MSNDSLSREDNLFLADSKPNATQHDTLGRVQGLRYETSTAPIPSIVFTPLAFQIPDNSLPAFLWVKK